jgi:hypothetical protein
MRLSLTAALLLWAAAGCAAAPACPDSDQVAERAKDPAGVFPAFQELVRCGDYGLAHKLLSPETVKRFPYEAFAIAFTTYEPPRRMIAGAEVHRVDPAAGRIRVCNPEFGVGRELRLAKFHTIYTLDLSSDDIEYLKGRTFAWFRHQTDRADGWHFAYPPDWDYAPLGRSCICGKRA